MNALAKTVDAMRVEGFMLDIMSYSLASPCAWILSEGRLAELDVQSMTGSSKRSMVTALPVSGSTSSRAPARRTSFLATSSGTPRWV